MKKLYILLLALFAIKIANTQVLDTNLWVTNGAVYAIACDNNYAYIGGDFTYIGPNVVNGAKLTTTNEMPDIAFPRVSNQIRVVVPDGNGGWYIGGSFLKVGGYNRNSIAHIKADKTVDAAWNPNSNNDVYSIAISGSDIYVGGAFTSIGGQTRCGIAKLNNINGNADLAWNANSSSTVYTIAINGTDIYVGGAYTSIGGQTRNYLAKLNNINGNADLTWNPNANDYITSIAISGSDIYAGGFFSSIGGQTRNKIAKLNNTDGNADATWNPNASPTNSTVSTIAISGSDIYVGGGFTTIGGQTRNYIAKLNNTNGNADVTWNPNATGFTGVNTICLNGSDIYVGGSFSSIGGQMRNNIAKLNNTNGNADAIWNPNPNYQVLSIAISGNNVYVGGSFSSIGRKAMNRISRLNKVNGDADLTWNPNADSTIKAIAISGSDIYVGGNFKNIGGQARNYIAKLNNTNGNADAIWNPNPAYPVLSVAIDGNDIYAGGKFYNIGGQTRQGIAKLNNTNGDADPLWNPNINAGGWVYSIVIKDSNIYAGGSYTSTSGQTRKNIAKFNNTNGYADLTWNPNPSSTVLAIAINGNDIYVGGKFTSSIGGKARNYIAKLNNTNGNADTLWNPSADAQVNSIAINDTNIYAGGNFTIIGGQTRYSITKLNNTNGSADSAWNAQSYNVNSIVISGNDVYVGGMICNSKFINFNNKVKGITYNDINNNVIKEINEPGLPNVILKYTGVHNNDRSYAVSDNNGKYTLLCNIGNYKVSIPNIKYATITPIEYNGNFNGYNSTDTAKNFAFNFIPNIKDLEITLTSLTRQARRGNNVSYQIDYRNVGTDTLSGNVELNYDNKLTYVNSNPNYDSQTGNKLSWNYINLKPREKKSINITFHLSSSAQLGDSLLNIATIYPVVGDTTPINNVDTLYQIIWGSYDPNVKEVFPKGDISTAKVTDGQEMVYTIHFQNTGTDTAFTVRIEDVLSSNLDIPYIETIASSHPYTWNFKNNNTVEWTFNNINLPDSGTNEPLSHGFVKYKILLLNTLLNGDVIKNNASIYFDCNSPIVTNTVTTLIKDKATSIKERKTVETVVFKLYPNPANTQITIELPQISKQSTITIFNINGQELITQQANTNKTEIDVRNLPSGIYFIKVVNEKGVSVGKFIKE